MTKPFGRHNFSERVWRFVQRNGFDNQNFNEVFTVHNNEEARYYTLLSGIMGFYAEQNYPCGGINAIKLPVDETITGVMRSNHAPEQERIDRMMDPYLHRPIVAIHWSDSATTTIVDGCHRILKLHELGEKSVNCWLFRYPFWKQFEFLDAPFGAEALQAKSNYQQMDKFNQSRTP